MDAIPLTLSLLLLVLILVYVYCYYNYYHDVFLIILSLLLLVLLLLSLSFLHCGANSKSPKPQCAESFSQIETVESGLMITIIIMIIIIIIIIIITIIATIVSRHSGPRKPCWQIYAHGLRGYVGASARAASLRMYGCFLRGTILGVQPVHLHQHTGAARARKCANMVSANIHRSF